jgi:hypothetical protein
MKIVRVFALALSVAVIVPALTAAQAAKPAETPQVAKAVPAARAGAPAAKLPPAILIAFQQAYPKATIKNAAKETENGKTVWEVESIDNGLARDLIYNADGTVVEMEEQVEPASLPAAVSAAFKAKYPKATITKAEKLMKGTTVTYEMALKGAAVKTIEITPDGKIVPVAKEAKEDKEKK